MKKISFFCILALIILLSGCTSSVKSGEKPIAKGYVNLCTSDPAQERYWQTNNDVIWNMPWDNARGNESKRIAEFPSCDNASVTIWEYKTNGSTAWDHITLGLKNGRSYDGWITTDHIIKTSDETGTEWSNNYSSIVGLWDQTQRGNGAKIWYDFKTDGTYTLNYDMRGNGDNFLDQGSWVYAGNSTYDLISNSWEDHRYIYLTINHDGRSFNSGSIQVVTNSGQNTTQDLVYAKE